jgi:hypothetical protein
VESFKLAYQHDGARGGFVGYGPTREAAERNARELLRAMFGELFRPRDVIPAAAVADLPAAERERIEADWNVSETAARLDTLEFKRLLRRRSPQFLLSLLADEAEALKADHEARSEKLGDDHAREATRLYCRIHNLRKLAE